MKPSFSAASSACCKWSLRATRAADTPGRYHRNRHQHQRKGTHQNQRKRSTILYPTLRAAARTATRSGTTARHGLIRLASLRGRAGTRISRR